MSDKTEGAFAIIAALVVMFSAMLDPRLSIMLSVVGLLLFGVYKFIGMKR